MCFSVLRVDWLVLCRWGGGWKVIGHSVDGGGVSSVSMLGLLTQREREGRMEKKARKGLSGQTKSFLYSPTYNIQPGKKMNTLKTLGILFVLFLLNLISTFSIRNHDPLISPRQYKSDFFSFWMFLFRFTMWWHSSFVCMPSLEGYVRLRTCLGSRCLYLMCVCASVCVFIYPFKHHTAKQTSPFGHWYAATRQTSRKAI